MIWAIGDIHGMFDPLRRLVSEIRLLEESDDPVEKVVFIGDYIDHGPSSREVIDLIRRLDYDTVALMGNHEDMALRYIKNDEPYLEENGNTWLMNGVGDTYLSLCGDADNIHKFRLIRAAAARSAFQGPRYRGLELPKVYERFLSSLKCSHVETLSVGGVDIPVTFLHALPAPGRPLSAQKPRTWRELNDSQIALALELFPELAGKAYKTELVHRSRALMESSILWGREYDFREGYGGELIVHGHTPTPYYLDFYQSVQYRDPDLWSQFESFPAASLAPFLFSRGPSVRWETIQPAQAAKELALLGASSDWRGEGLEAMSYGADSPGGVEAVNIDTGAVLGGGLTALGLSPKYLANGWLLTLVYRNDGDQRRKFEKVIRRAIKITKLGASF
jgi:hypothetical protein